MNRHIQSIDDVVEYQLCSGCGLCAYMEPERFHMADVVDYGRRPFLKNPNCQEVGNALAVCPGSGLEHTYDSQESDVIKALSDGWGPVREVFEGFATDEEIRYAGSSGGAATAIALFCLELGGMHGVLHVAARKDVPYMNRTVMSRTRTDLLAATGSRYAPASPCDGLDLIEKSGSSCVFIGKPCDVAGVQKARKLRPELDKNIGVTIAFFCAGVPSTKGTLELLKKIGIEDPDTVTDLRYRGNGWPGLWTVNYKDKDELDKTKQITYSESWDFLQRYRQWRCYICPDHTGEFADIAVGDPWYREIKPGEYGNSLIVARTKRGQDILRAAVRAGYISLETSDPSLLPRSQSNLLNSRGQLWARLKVLHLMGAAVPRYRGFALFRFWLRLSLKDKISSFTGTFKRILIRGLYKRVMLEEFVFMKRNSKR